MKVLWSHFNFEVFTYVEYSHQTLGEPHLWPRKQKSDLFLYAGLFERQHNVLFVNKLLNETEYYRNLAAPPNYGFMLRSEFPDTAYAAHVFACHFSKCATFSPALSISRAYLIKIPFSKLLLMAFVDLSDASLHRKTKRCRFLRRSRCRMPQKPTLWPNERFNIARSLRNINAPSVINTSSRHSTCLHRFGF